MVGGRAGALLLGDQRVERAAMLEPERDRQGQGNLRIGRADARCIRQA